MGLDWEEGLWKVVAGWWRRGHPGPPPPPGAVELAPLTRRLAALSSWIAGRPMDVQSARGQGGLRGDLILLPERIALFDDPEANAGVYVLRAVVAARLRAGVDPGGFEAPSPTEGSAAAQAPPAGIAAAAAALRRELPAFGAAWDAATTAQAAAGVVLLWGPEYEAPELPPAAGDEAPGADHDATELEAPAADELRVHHLERPPLELPVHSFEKVEFADSFNGSFRRPDGSDELGDHLDALQEVELGDLLRGGPSTGSVLKADLGLDADVPDVADIDADEPFVAYPEWDRRGGRYRPGWCRVYPSRMPDGDGAWAREALARHRPTVARLLALATAQRDRLRARPRSADGEDVDIDAVVDAWADLRAGHDPGERLYVQAARPEPDRATTILLDTSLSTDSWVAGRRVGDVAREAVAVLAEVAALRDERLQILAFASHTRHRVRCWTVQDWHEPWALGQRRLGRVEPQGYTRIGPALRHAIAGLCAVDARRRSLLLVSDGKPTDYDRYEGRHGISDVGRALREARRLGVRVHALAIDRAARSWLPAMFGAGSWAVLSRAEDLPDALAQVWQPARR